jgi:hypothetical protein
VIEQRFVAGSSPIRGMYRRRFAALVPCDLLPTGYRVGRMQNASRVSIILIPW